MRWALLLALALLASPVQAKVLVVEPYKENYSADNQRVERQMVLGVLNTLGVDYDVARWGPLAGPTSGATSSLRTDNCRTGTWAGKSYAAVIHMGFARDRNFTIGVSLAGYFPDSLTLAAKWPLVPTLFVGGDKSVANKWVDGSRCTTGIRSPGGGEFLIAQRSYDYAFYRHGGNEVWKSTGMNWHANWIAAGSGTAPPGIWRPLVGAGTSAGAVNLSGITTKTDLDAVVRDAFPDTVVMWARYKVGNPALPLIFVDTGEIANDDPGLLAMAIAVLDSATGGQVIRKQVKQAAFVERWFATGRYDYRTSNDTLEAGQFCAADSCDTLNVTATMDSLNALGIPITFGCEVDSIGNFGYQRRQMERVSRFSVTPHNYAGTFGGPGIASKYRLNDIEGHLRARRLIPPSATTLPTTCSATDSSRYCLRRWAYWRLDSIWPGRVDHGVAAPGDDWSPLTLNRWDASKLDSITWVDYMAGARGGYVINLEAAEADVGKSSWQGGGLSGQGSPAAPRGFMASDMSYVARVPGTSTVLGRLKTLPCRGSQATTGSLPYYQQAALHDEVWEHKCGLWTGNWYTLTDLMTYEHSMYLRTNVWSVNANGLGGSGQGTRASRNAYWPLKWLVNQARVTNAYAGKTVVKFVKLEDL